MADHYKLKCGTLKNVANLFDFSNVSPSFRITEYERTRKESSVAIPYAGGVKDTSDGTEGPGTLTATGTITMAGHLAELWVRDIHNILLDAADDYWVWMEWDGVATTYYRVHHLQSIRHSYADGWGGDKWEVSITWAVYDPEFSN